MTDTVLAQLAALKTAPINALKDKWRELFGTEPPPYIRLRTEGLTNLVADLHAVRPESRKAA